MSGLKLLGTTLICFTLLLVATHTKAAWFEASGEAIIINGDTDSAREKATESALTQALLFAGASIKSVQQMANGLLLDNSFQITSAGEVNQVQIISEQISNDRLIIKLRADVFAEPNRCQSSQYVKLVSTAKMAVKPILDARIGSMQQLGQYLPQRLDRAFKRLSPQLHLNFIDERDFEINTSLLHTIGRQHNSQLFVTGTILDLSLEEADGFNPFGKEYLRNFSIRFDVYDSATSELMLTRTYQVTSPYTYQLREAVNLSSASFWRSEYGTQIDNVLAKFVLHLQEETECSPTYGRVLGVSNNSIQINLGKQHQVQVGDELTLFNVTNLDDGFGNNIPSFQLHPVRLRVQQVQPKTSLLVASEGELLGNIQRNDFVAKM